MESAVEIAGRNVEVETTGASVALDSPGVGGCLYCARLETYLERTQLDRDRYLRSSLKLLGEKYEREMLGGTITALAKDKIALVRQLDDMAFKSRLWSCIAAASWLVAFAIWLGKVK